ncbi:MAG: metal ABC transporter permease [Candidatus Dormibacteria bacterium]
MLGYPFMQHAFLAGSAAAVMAGVVGYFVVLRGEAFAAHTLSVAGFSGAAGAALLGVPQLLGLGVLCTGASLGIGVLGRGAARDRRAESAAIGTIQAFAIALGFLFASLYRGLLESVFSILFGTFLGITAQQVVLMAVMAAVVVASMAFIGRPLLFSSVDEDAARAAGVPVGRVALVFMVMLGVGAAASATITGALLVFALLIVPAATAQQLTARASVGIALSVAIGMATVWASLSVSYLTDLPIGFLVTGIGFVIYAVARGARHAGAPQ